MSFAIRFLEVFTSFQADGHATWASQPPSKPYRPHCQFRYRDGTVSLRSHGTMNGLTVMPESPPRKLCWPLPSIHFSAARSRWPWPEVCRSVTTFYVTPPLLPAKKDVARALLLRGSVFIHLDPRKASVLVPARLRLQPQVVLQVGLDMPVPIPDLRVYDE